MPRRRRIIGATIERNDPSLAAIRVSTIRCSVSDVMYSIPDVLIVAGQSIREVDVKCLRRTISPRLVIGHSGPANIDHASVAGGRVGGAPAMTAEAIFEVDVGLIMDTVQAL